MKLFTALLFGCCLSTALAANDPDSIGRSVKYLDYANPVLLSLHTQSCAIGPPGVAVRCHKLNGTDGEAFNVTNISEVDVADGSRSLIDFTSHSPVTYFLRNGTSARKSSSLALFLVVTVESDVLNDPSLINPLTGAPFNGKIEIKTVILVDVRQLEPNETVNVTTRPDIASSAGLLNRKSLIQNYGLSPTLARQVTTRQMKVRLGISGTSTGVTSVVVNVGGRLLSD